MPHAKGLCGQQLCGKSEKLKYKQKFEQADKNAKIWKDRFEKLNKDYEELKKKPSLSWMRLRLHLKRSGLLSMPSSPGGKELYEHKHPARNRGQDMEI